MADSFDQFELVLREWISPAAIDLELEDDDPMWNLTGTFQPETVGGRRADGSAGYEAQYRIRVQSGARMAGGVFTGNTPVAMGKDSHLFMGQAANALYLDPTKTPMRSWIEIRLLLQRIKGSVTINTQQIMAELATQPIDEIAGNEVIDAVRRLRSYIVNAIYSDGTASMAQALAGGSVTETAGGVEITLTNGTFARFMMGDLIVAGTNANPRVQKAGNINGYMRVVNIDADNRSIYLQSEPGEGTITISANDHLMLAETYNFGGASHAVNSLVPQGIESLLISSGIYPGSISTKFASGLDVAHHSVLKGFVEAKSSADPTVAEITVMLDKMADAGKAPPPALIGQRSMWTLQAQLDQEAQVLVSVPMGAEYEAAGGVAGPMVSHQRHRFEKFDSARIKDGSLFGITPSTFRKYVPLGDRTIRWFYSNGPMAGANSIFGPVHQGNQTAELAEAPLDSFFQLGCIDPRRNFRASDFKTQRDV